MSVLDEIIKKDAQNKNLTQTESAILTLWEGPIGYEFLAQDAAEELAALQARITELEAHNARMNFRLGWVYDNYGDTTALRFALEAEDTEIDEKMNNG